MTVENILFSLIRSEILDHAPDERIKEELTAEAYKELYVLSNKHDMAHVVASALSRLDLLKEDEVSVHFQRQLMLALHRDKQREYALELTSKVLEKAGVPHVPLKGAVLRHIYPQSFLRTSCDIDVLVKKEDTEKAGTALLEAGFFRMDDCSTHDYNYSAPNKIHLELHFTLEQSGTLSACNPILSAVWERHASSEGSCVYRLSAEFFTLYHLAHLGQHLLGGGCGIRPFLDLWLIERHMEIDHEQLNALLAESGLEALYSASMKLSKVFMEDLAPDVQTAQLAEYVLGGGVYGTATNAAKVKAAKGTGKIKSFLKLVFLPRKNLQVLYPDLKKHPILFPFYQVKRWFRVFEKNKRQKVKHLTNARNAVSLDERNSTKNLLEGLGLVK
jgi:hypothetical protein